MNGLRRCLRRGLGLTLCPEIAVRDDLAAGRLAALPWAGFSESGDAGSPPSVGRKDNSRKAASYGETAREPSPHEGAGSLEAAVVMIWHQDKWCSPLLRGFMDLAVEAMSER